MGNSHVFHHRIPAVTTACLSTTALTLMAISTTSCSMLNVKTIDPEDLLLISEEVELTTNEATIGVLCKTAFSEQNEAIDDPMWMTSRSFTYISLSLGAIACALAWAVSTFLPPTTLNWKMISILASITAVVQVPVMLLLEAYPCVDFPETQSCHLSSASFILIASTVLWIGVTLCTQCMDPPLWALELSAWRTPNRKTEMIPEVPNQITTTQPNSNNNRKKNKNNVHEDDDRQRLRAAAPKKSNKAKSSLTTKRSWKDRLFFRRANNNLYITSTEESFLNDDGENDNGDGDENNSNLGRPNGGESPALAYDMNTSLDDRVILRVLPNGRRPADQDAKSLHSFEDLDSMVEMAEEGRRKQQPQQQQQQQQGAFDRSAPPQFFRPSLPTAEIKPDRDVSFGDELQVRGKKSSSLSNLSSPTVSSSSKRGSPPRSASRHDNGSQAAFFNPLQPSEGKANIKIIKESDVPVDSLLAAQSQPTNKSDNSPRQQPPQPPQQKQQEQDGLDPMAILEDLQDQSLTMPSPASSIRRTTRRSSNKEKTPAEKGKRNDRFRTGIRALTTKIRMDTIRRSTRATNAYALMDDNMSGGTSNYSSPPIEVKIDAADLENAEKLTLDDDQHDNDERFMTQEWHNFHEAINSGVRQAELNDDDDDDDDAIDRAFGIGGSAGGASGSGVEARNEGEFAFVNDATMSASTPRMHGVESDISYSDPEPLYSQSGDSASDLSLNYFSARSSSQNDNVRSQAAQPTNRDDNSARSTGSQRRGRTAGGSANGSIGSKRRTPTQRRRAASPVPSIRSTTSLLDTSIIEETDADIMAETVLERKHQQRLRQQQQQKRQQATTPPSTARAAAYPLKRTSSAPEQGFVSQRGRAVNRQAAGGAKSVAAAAASPTSAPSQNPPSIGSSPDNEVAPSPVAVVPIVSDNANAQQQEEQQQRQTQQDQTQAQEQVLAQEQEKEQEQQQQQEEEEEEQQEEQPDDELMIKTNAKPAAPTQAESDDELKIPPKQQAAPASPAVIVPATAAVAVAVAPPADDGDEIMTAQPDLSHDDAVSDEDTDFSPAPLPTNMAATIHRNVPSSNQSTGFSLISANTSFEDVWNDVAEGEKAKTAGGMKSSPNAATGSAATNLGQSFSGQNEAGNTARSLAVGSQSKTASVPFRNSWNDERDLEGGFRTNANAAARTPTKGNGNDNDSHNENGILKIDGQSPTTADAASNRAELARNARMRRLTSITPGNDSSSDQSDGNQSATKSHRSARLARIGRLRKQNPPSREASPGTPTKSNCRASKVKYERLEDGGEFESEVVDALDLQLIEVRRPLGVEYGSDEASM